jgi:hypothetical protein
MYNHSNIYNIAIYFYNIHMKHLQHAYETSETLETCVLQHRGGQGRTNPAVGVVAGDEQQSASTTSTSGGASTTTTSATSTRLGSARWATRMTGRARTTSINAGGRRVPTAVKQSRHDMGGAGSLGPRRVDDGVSVLESGQRPNDFPIKM